MSRNKIIILLILAISSCVYGQQTFSPNIYSKSSTTIDSLSFKTNKSFWQRDAVTIGAVPTLFFIASGVTWSNREEISKQRNRYIPSFNSSYDDYMQYAPAAVTFGLKAAGVQGRNDMKRSAITYATSMAIMAILVNGIKYTAKVERPDKSANNSFPSGHSAMAFANAAFLDKEYGLVNPMYSIAGYTSATFTGVGRSLNNRHWVSDIFAGAGIGILSTQLAYFFVDKIYGNKGDNLSILSKFEDNANPSFLSIKLGVVNSLESIVEGENEEALAKLGWEAGIEGAYFFNKHWGVGAQMAIAGFPFAEAKITDSGTNAIENTSKEVLSESLGNLTLSIGPYYAFHFSDKWKLMLKALGGYSIGANGYVSLQVLSHEVDIPDYEKNQESIAAYSPKNAFQITTGAAITYNFSDNLGATLYSDYNYSEPQMNITVDENINDQKLPQTYTVKNPFSYLTLGIRLTAYF